MFSIKPDKIADGANLKKLLSNAVVLAPLDSAIRGAYRRYKASSGCTSMVPIMMSTLQKDAFGSAYKNKSKASGCSWIDNLYLNGLLCCPMCGGLGARTIDHYLPQASYPEFAVFSHNLVSCCHECNSKRGDYNSHLVNPRLLHPYYDVATLNRLELHVVCTIYKKGIIGYELDFNSHAFTAADCDRIQNHIVTNVDEAAFLNVMYGKVSDLKIDLRGFSTIERQDEITAKLANLLKYGRGNSWEGALYRGLLLLSAADLMMVV